MFCRSVKNISLQFSPFDSGYVRLIDEGVTSIKAKYIGYEINGHCFSCLGFADDLIIIASNKDGLQEQIDGILECLLLGGLSPNPRKCQSLSIIGEGKKQTLVVRVLAYHGRKSIGIECGWRYRYLGIEFTAIIIVTIIANTYRRYC